MNKYRLAIILFFLFVQKYSSCQMVYDIQLSDLDGSTVRIGELKGEKLTVVDFWATWCRPCLNSIPELIKLSDLYSEKGVKFIGINEDGPRNATKVRPFAVSLGINYPVLFDTEQTLLTNFLVDGFPTLIILDKNGKPLFTHLGYTNGDENIIADAIEKLLSDKD